MARREPYSDSAWYWPRKESTWHAYRKPDITATSAAALFGVSPYQTPFELFHKLAGNLDVVFEETERMLWGKRLQNVIAEGICEDNGWQIVDRSPYLYARSPFYSGMGASPDYVIRDSARPERGLGLLEIKNVDSLVAKDDWTAEEAPVHIEFQLQHQLEACRLGWGVVGGLIGGNKPLVYERDRDQDVGAEIGRRILEMHDRVARRDAPEPDYLADYEAIRALYRNANVGETLDLGPSGGLTDDKRDHIQALVVAAHAAGVVKKQATEDDKRAKAELLVAIGGAERVLVPHEFKVSAGTVVKDAYSVEYPATSYRNLRITPIKPKVSK